MTKNITQTDEESTDWPTPKFDHPDIMYECSRCGRCGEWTHETGLGSYPLCPDCQTESGGQKREPVETPNPGEQVGLGDGWS